MTNLTLSTLLNSLLLSYFYFFFFFFNDTATTEIYTLSLHDALPIFKADVQGSAEALRDALAKLSTEEVQVKVIASGLGDRKSTRLNSSHLVISYAVFCLKKKKKNQYNETFVSKR